MTEHGTDIDSLVAIGEALAEVSGLETAGDVRDQLISILLNGVLTALNAPTEIEIA